MSKALWDDMVVASSAYQEAGDCGVKALAIVADISYGQAWDLLADKGRKPRRGTRTAMIHAVLQDLGFTLAIETFVHRRPTPLTIGYKRPTGKYLCYTRTHGLALVDGKVIDWTAGRRHHIKQIVKVTKEK